MMRQWIAMAILFMAFSYLISGKKKKYGILTLVACLFHTSAIIGFVIVLFSQISISSNYNKYKRIRNNKKISGQEVARMILDKNGLTDVHVVSVNGNLTDHYDPTRKVVRLSNEIFDGTSIAALSVAAHECGHAIQDKENYTFMRIRSALVPFVNFVTYLGYFSLIISLIAGITG